MRCSICAREIPEENGWKEGHNAQPVNDGRCCGHCNDSVVIPNRLRQMMAKEITDDVLDFMPALTPGFMNKDQAE